MKCCRFGASSVYTIQRCTRLQCHFIQCHIGRVYAYLAVTCHLHFWQNDLDLLRATAVTRGWNGYRNKSQHRRKLSRRSCRDSNPRPFNHGSGALTTELSRSRSAIYLYIYLSISLFLYAYVTSYNNNFKSIYPERTVLF